MLTKISPPDRDGRDLEIVGERERDVVGVSRRVERDPRVGRAIVVGVAAGALAERDERMPGPGEATVGGCRGALCLRGAGAPTVLLVDTNNVERIRRVHGDERLGLGVRKVDVV